MIVGSNPGYHTVRLGKYNQKMFSFVPVWNVHLFDVGEPSYGFRFLIMRTVQTMHLQGFVKDLQKKEDSLWCYVLVFCVGFLGLNNLS